MGTWTVERANRVIVDYSDDGSVVYDATYFDNVLGPEKPPTEPLDYYDYDGRAVTRKNPVPKSRAQIRQGHLDQLALTTNVPSLRDALIATLTDLL